LSRRRSRRLASATTAAPSPTTPPFRLLDLPTDLLLRALSRCDPADIARVAAVSLLFHASLAVEGIRLWAQERGFELPAQPEGEGCAVRWLCFAALLREANPPARLAAGAQHSVFIDGEGRLSSCGTAAEGEDDEDEDTNEVEFPGLLGHGEGVLQLKTPTCLPSPSGGERAIGVAASQYFSLALTADGALWSWGSGGQGELGHGDRESRWQPKKIDAFASQCVVTVSASFRHSLAITADGAVWSWGGGGQEKLGHANEEFQLLPKKVLALASQRVVAVSAGLGHSLALTADGAVFTWGQGGDGCLGHGDEQSQLLPKKIEALAGQRVVAIAAGASYSLALTADAVFAWGQGGCGCLGHGEDVSSQLLPKKVEGWAPGQ